MIIAIVGLAVGAGFRSFSESYLSALKNSDTALSREVRAREAYISFLRSGGTSVKLIFGGDVMVARSVAEKISGVGNGDPRFPFWFIASTTRSADVAFVNSEGTISNRGKNQGSAYSFRANPSVMEGFTFAGFDIVSLANNHIWDWGGDALKDTASNFKGVGIKTVGAGGDSVSANEPAIVSVRGIKIGFLGYTTLYPKSLEAGDDRPGISSFSMDLASRAIRDLKEKVDVVVVSMHWGDEYKTSSNGEQKRMARALVDAGADLVIGHHPHVTEEVEMYRSPLTGKESLIAYSLGNLVFDQYFSKETMESFLLEVKLDKHRILSVERIPVRLNENFQPVPVL